MDWKTFIKAGRATFTLENAMTGGRFTYRVSRCKDPDKELWFVSVLNGPDNEASYSYIGTVFGNRFRWTQKARVHQDAQSYRTFLWLNGVLNSEADLPENVKFYHAGRCGRCGRTLTVPASIECGFGPECVGLVYGDNPCLSGHIPLETARQIRKLLDANRKIQQEVGPCDS